jgi:hypothetical protein
MTTVSEILPLYVVGAETEVKVHDGISNCLLRGKDP